MARERRGACLMAASGVGLALFVGQGPRRSACTAGARTWLSRCSASWTDGRVGIGAGGAVVLIALLSLLSIGLALRGAFGGDAFVAGAMTAVAASILLFTAWPILHILAQAFQDGDGAFAPALGVRAAGGGEDLGPALPDRRRPLRRGVEHADPRAAAAAPASTALGLAFALIVTRTGFRFKKALRVLSVLPIITPPFVIGLGADPDLRPLGRSSTSCSNGHSASSRRAGSTACQGVLLAQVFAFTPIAFLVLIGVVEGVAPTLEEAAQTLRADRWRTFVDSFAAADAAGPRQRVPDHASSKSIADFGNPIVLGGNFGVLSTEVFFSVVGAQLDQGRAAALGILLLLASRSRAFFVAAPRARAQGLHGDVRQGRRRPADAAAATARAGRCYAVALPWVALTVVHLRDRRSPAASSRRGAATTRRRCGTTSRRSASNGRRTA